MAFAKKLLDVGVAVTPGVGFGKHGEGYVRITIHAAKRTHRGSLRDESKKPSKLLFFIYGLIYEEKLGRGSVASFLRGPKLVAAASFLT